MKIFEEETTNEAKQVPFFEDVKGSAGYTGHETGKSDRELLSQIALALGTGARNHTIQKRPTWKPG